MSPSDEERVNQYLRSIVREILQEWDGWRARQQPFHLANHDVDPDATKRYLLVFGIACQAHEAAKGYLVALNKAPVAATPVARSCFELGMTAQWAAQVSDAWAAIANRKLWNDKVLADSLVESEELDNRKAGKKMQSMIAANNYQELPTNSSALARNFQQLCDDLEGAKEYYLTYRFLSRESHPGVFSGDAWFVPSEDGTQMRMQYAPTVPHQGWLHIVACSLIWAESAVDHLDRGHERKAHLEEVAASIKSPVSFHPTEESKDRVQGIVKNSK